MATKLSIRLDPQTGSLPKPPEPNFVYRLGVDSILRLELEAGSPFNTSSTSLMMDLKKYTSPSDPYTSIQGQTTPLGNWYVEIPLITPGCFNLYLQHPEKKSHDNWIVVTPKIRIGLQEIPLEAVCLQTVLSRCLGPYTRWESVLAEQKKLGYNFIHITPIQKLGMSNSLYSIQDHLALSTELFPGFEKETQKLEALKETIDRLENVHGIGCVVDVVLNHCATTSPFIAAHPEAGYNLTNSPYLRAAYDLDKALFDFSNQLSMGKVPSYPFRNTIENEKDLRSIMHILRVELVPSLRLHEYFQMDVDRVYAEFVRNEASVCNDASLVEEFKRVGLENWIFTKALLNEGAIRMGVTLDHALIWGVCKTANIRNIPDEIKKALRGVNSKLLARFEKHFQEIFVNIEADIRYHKIQQRDMTISFKNTLVGTYFREVGGVPVLCNGFVMDNKNVLQDIACKDAWHYLRRNVVNWSDCIKLRYGETAADCPVLWDTMEKYVKQMAKVFKGLRLDNAHGTPLAVTSHMLQVAREVNPGLLVFAELFTGDARTDALFVERLGINALVREAMQAWDSRQLGANCYEYGNGRWHSLGSFESSDLTAGTLRGLSPVAEWRHLNSSPVPALFYDCTHDNETPNQKRTAQDSLPNAAIVAWTNCASASTRGYDELIPAQLSVVTENRLYKLHDETTPRTEEYSKVYPLGNSDSTISVKLEYISDKDFNTVEIKGDWNSWSDPISLHKVGNKWGICIEFPSHLHGKQYMYKYILNKKDWVIDSSLPTARTPEGYVNNQITIESGLSLTQGVFPDLRQIRKLLNEFHIKMSHEGYSETYVHQITDDSMMIIRQNPNTLESYILFARNIHRPNDSVIAPKGLKLPGVLESIEFYSHLSIHDWRFIPDAEYVNGLHGRCVLSKNIDSICDITRDSTEGVDVVNFKSWPTGAVLAVKSRIAQERRNAIDRLNEAYNKLNSYETCADLFENVTLEDVNHLLWKCGAEELDSTHGKRDLYEIPAHRKFNYAGLGSLMVEFLPLIKRNDLGHAICNNIRAGDWLLNYHIQRIEQSSIPTSLKDFLTTQFRLITQLPRGVIPKHIVKLVLLTYRNLHYHLVNSMYSQVFRIGDDSLLEALGVAATQFWGDVPSARTHLGNLTLSAGLPFFATGFMRCWGRDTFIAMRGLLLCTGRFEEARQIILTYASVMRHGMIPNLLDGGNNSRYNARDATWWFLQAVQDYIKMSPEGTRLLTTEVEMKFRSDNQSEHFSSTSSRKMTISDIIHQILQSHASGIRFREWNAGLQIDAHMRDEGFNVSIRFDKETGLIYGGNRWNCGTWMDKMGSSQKANNKGVPATPRDGAAVELTGMLYSTVKFLSELSQDGTFPYREVNVDGGKLSYTEWAEKLKSNFERLYWVSENDTNPNARNKGVYKDTLGSEIQHADFQLRPNQCIAMAVAPDLFDRSHAATALRNIERALLPAIGSGQLGIRTLNEEDPHYRQRYDNDDDSNNYSTAHGFSYHNGPEWLWPIGYFLRAAHQFGTHTKPEIMRILGPHRDYLSTSLWFSLPELTNAYGEENKFSCPAQAWSIGCIIDILYDLVRS